jgi:hypothetical protein
MPRFTEIRNHRTGIDSSWLPGAMHLILSEQISV